VRDAAATEHDQRSRFEDVFRQHGERLSRSLLLFAGDADVAADALSEAFVQAIRRGSAIESPLAWVTKAAYRIAAGELQERRRHYPIADDRAYEMPEPALDLVRALATLTPKQRAAAVLHFYDGYTKAETAALIGSTASAVGVHLFRAKAKLRDLLGDDDG
jgi:RNA polymerase sigma-70 factor (ECF subfamily)